MIEAEKKKLHERSSEYLSIGITKGGEVRSITHVPWEKTVHAHNMKIPDVYISPEDLKNAELLKSLHGYRVIGCYIYTPLDDYNFLGTFTELRDVHVECAQKLTDLGFLRSLRECAICSTWRALALTISIPSLR